MEDKWKKFVEINKIIIKIGSVQCKIFINSTGGIVTVVYNNSQEKRFFMENDERRLKDMLEDIKLTLKDTGKHFSTGSAYMIGFLTIAGFMSLFAQIFADFPIAEVFTTINSFGMEMFIPILAGYIAFGIADRQALASGIITGLFAYSLGTGFIGGLVVGFLCGYLTMILNHVKMPSALETFWSWFIPVIVTVIVGLILNYLLAPPIAALSGALEDFLTTLLNMNPILLGLVLGAFAGVDFGGPINKVGFLFSSALLAEGITEPMAIFMPACAVVSLGMGLAVLMKPKLYSRDERESGKTALTLGITLGFSEGALPFAINDFWRVMAASIAGSAVTGMIGGAFRLTTMGPNSGMITGPMTSNNPIGYFAALIPGVLVCAFLVNFLKRNRVPAELEDEE